MRNIAGICGAPCTGKTTLARSLHASLARRGLECMLLPEPARLLAERGVKIDAAMRDADYDAFLTAYGERDAHPAPLCIADRTPLDHYCYLAVNRSLGRHWQPDEQFLARHRAAALAGMRRYRLLIYLPNCLPLIDDRFRVTDPAYQQALDGALCEIVSAADVPLVTVPLAKKQRKEAALAAISAAWPELFMPAPLEAQAG